jgi:hypothetical protein
MIRVGIESGRTAVLARAKLIGAPILVSANSLWRHGQFIGWRAYEGFDVALDSGGFVAMRRYGGYRFTPEQYGALVAQMRPTWWAQMDFCCEPELAANRSAVAKRIDATARHLEACRRVATELSIEMPLLVLQGWKPQDYCQGPIYEQNYQWPDLIGVGSVCRRNVNGPDGVLAVVDAIDRVLPANVKLHLFGVKSAALKALRHHPRFESMDSMAWSMRARWHAIENGLPCSGEMRADFLQSWYKRQQNYEDQRTLA